MPERISRATVATCVALAGAGFGGAYALAHDGPAAPAPDPAAPTTIRLAHDPIGDLHRASPLPALIVPPPRTQPTAPVTVPEDTSTVATTPAPEVPAATPTPTPAPASRPKPAPARKPLTFDDSG